MTALICMGRRILSIHLRLCTQGNKLTNPWSLSGNRCSWKIPLIAAVTPLVRILRQKKTLVKQEPGDAFNNARELPKLISRFLDSDPEGVIRTGIMGFPHVIHLDV